MGGPRHRGLLRQLAHYASLKHLRLGVGLEAVERAHRAKDLLRGDYDVGCHIGQYSRLEESPALGARLLPRTTLAPFLTASTMCASTFSTASLTGFC
jgi:hypothetical protein